jgi:hypothetical protein
MTEQEAQTTKEAKQYSVKSVRPWFIRSAHGGIKACNKGAKARLMGLINFEGSSYLYIEGESKSGDCEVVSLVKVFVDKQKLDPVLIGETPTDNPDVNMLVYEIPEVTFNKKGSKYRDRRFRLQFKIWSESKSVKFKAQ